ncbi:MAG: hypothetical protein GX995_04210 [Clostridiales bacterium]|nr:hypothetical protein [Clostridiales bacterium]
MNTGTIVLLVILAIVIIAFIALAIWGNKMQKKAAESEKEIRATSQVTSMLIIDKKKMKITEAGLPQMVIDQTPKYLRRSKVPIVKAKVGPQIRNFICNDQIFDLVPVKKEVKAEINGLYIIDIRGLRTNLEKPEKLTFSQKIKRKANDFVKKDQNNNTKKK